MSYKESGNVIIGQASGTGFVGTGLWTLICIAFANIFGVSSSAYEKKLYKAKK